MSNDYCRGMSYYILFLYIVPIHFFLLYIYFYIFDKIIAMMFREAMSVVSCHEDVKIKRIQQP